MRTQQPLVLWPIVAAADHFDMTVAEAVLFSAMGPWDDETQPRTPTPARFLARAACGAILTTTEN